MDSLKAAELPSHLVAIDRNPLTQNLLVDMFSYKGIILTHTYLYSDNTRGIKTGYPLEGVLGEELWQRLIGPSANIEMVFCGHKAGNSHREHVGYRIDKNAGNKDVHQILFNAQWEGGGANGNGGDTAGYVFSNSYQIKRE